MGLSRRQFLNQSALSVVGGVALTSLSVAAHAQETPVPLPVIPAPPVPQPAPPVAAAPIVPAPIVPPVAPVSGEGQGLADAAESSAGFPLSQEDHDEVLHELSAYPASVKDLRDFSLHNNDAPSIAVTPSLRAPVQQKVFGITL